MGEVTTAAGDLLDQQVDAIVNPWNRNFIPWWLLLPQGVSGAIKRRGGYGPFREIARAGILEPGEGRATNAGRLPFRAIIHVAALNGFWRSSPDIIRACTHNALQVASQLDLASLAVPLIGAGTGGVAPALAQSVIVDTAKRSTFPGTVVVVTWNFPPPGT